MLGKVMKFVVASSLIVGGVAIVGTVFAAKGIDEASNKWRDKLHDKFLN